MKKGNLFLWLVCFPIMIIYVLLKGLADISKKY